MDKGYAFAVIRGNNRTNIAEVIETRSFRNKKYVIVSNIESIMPQEYATSIADLAIMSIQCEMVDSLFSICLDKNDEFLDLTLGPTQLPSEHPTLNLYNLKLEGGFNSFLKDCVVCSNVVRIFDAQCYSVLNKNVSLSDVLKTLKSFGLVSLDEMREILNNSYEVTPGCMKYHGLEVQLPIIRRK